LKTCIQKNKLQIVLPNTLNTKKKLKLNQNKQKITALKTQNKK